MNPYAAPAVDISTIPSDDRADDGIIVKTAKGDVELTKNERHIYLTHQGRTKQIKHDKFVSKVGMVFMKKKHVIFKPLKLKAQVSDIDFLAILKFYGIDQFLQRDIRQMRVAYIIFGGWLILIGLSSIYSLHPDYISYYALVTLGILDLLMFAVTFTQLFVLSYGLNVVVNAAFVVLMAFFWYSTGRWWMAFFMLLATFLCIGNYAKFTYFRHMSRNHAA